MAVRPVSEVSRPESAAPKVEAKPWDVCPVCGEPMVIRCRCLIGDTACKNEHEWVWCSVHKRCVVIPYGVNTHAAGFPISMFGCKCGLETMGSGNGPRVR
jgi:hypothetical protein